MLPASYQTGHPGVADGLRLSTQPRRTGKEDSTISIGDAMLVSVILSYYYRWKIIADYLLNSRLMCVPPLAPRRRLAHKLACHNK
jgi:hypothetical protein